MAGYSRNDTGNNIADGNIINASDLDGEFDAVEAAFNNSTGHTHDGTSAEGAPIEKVGPVQDLVITATEVKPKTDNTLDLGTNTLEFKDLWLDGTANIDSLVADTADINAGTIDGTTIGGSTPAAGTFTTLTANGNVVLGDAATDTVTVTADVASDLIPSADGTYDLGASGSEWQDLFIDGTANIDSLVADTADINGGTIDGVTIGGASAGAGTFTTGQFNTSVNVDGTVTADGLTVDGDGTLQTSDGAILTLKSTDTTLASTEVVGSIQFNTADSSDAGVASKIEANAENASGEVGLNFHTGKASALNKRLNISRDGDISFYEDTGTTPKFFWDASAESLGIGTTGPARIIHASSSVPALRLEDSDVSGLYYELLGLATGQFDLRIDEGNVQANSAFNIKIDGSERMRIDSSGKVGIGVSSNLGSLLTIARNNSLGFMNAAGTASDQIIYGDSSSNLRFYTLAAERMRIDSSGNLYLGAASGARGSSATRQLVKLGTSQSYLEIQSASTTSTADGLLFSDGSTGNYGLVGYNHNVDALNFYTASAERMRIDSSGRLGIGTTSPLQLAHLFEATAATGAFLQVQETGGQNAYFGVNTSGGSIQVSGANPLQIATNGSERMRIDSTGNVGIGTPSPSSVLHVKGANAQIYVQPTADTETTGIIFRNAADGVAQGFVAYNHTSDYMYFRTNGSGEAMRIDSSGNLLVGTTVLTDIDSSGTGNEGAFIQSYGHLGIAVSNGECATFNRKTAEGDIIDFRYNGSPAGSIGAKNLDLYIGTGDTGLKFRDGVDDIIPFNTSTVADGGAISLGDATNRFKDLYLSGGVYVGGTTSANLLDDYEEGTWTPALKFGGGNTSMTFSSGYPKGGYTKIGNTVYAYFEIRLTNKGTSTGDMTIEGLPFTTSSNSFQGGALSRFANSGSNWDNNQLVYVEDSATVIKLGYASSGNTTLHTHADVNNFGVYVGFVIYNV